MRKFIIKLFIFSIPLIILFNIPKLSHFTFHEDIDKKINSLVDNNEEPMIIVCGDSRAERHIIPKLIEQRFGIKTINIGINAGDTAILYNAIEKYNLTNKNSTLIISISSIETNDNVIDEWGIPHSIITYISTVNNIKLFGTRYLNMLLERLRLIISELFLINKYDKLDPFDARIAVDGFRSISGNISEINFENIDIYSDTLKVIWYLNSVHDGVRKNVFDKVIDNIAKTDMNVILYQPTVAPSWLKRTKNTYIDSIELNHGKLLREISLRYDNISFIDFYSDQSATYHDSMYYNSTHFNFTGAEIFTKALIDTLSSRDLIPTTMDKN